MTVKILKYFIISLLIALVTTCAPNKKNTYYQKKKKAPRLETERIGINKYYFSPGYQKKLNKTFKKKN